MLTSLKRLTYFSGITTLEFNSRVSMKFCHHSSTLKVFFYTSDDPKTDPGK